MGLFSFIFGDDPEPPEPVRIDPREVAESQYEFGKKAAGYNRELQQSTFYEDPYGTLEYERVYAPGRDIADKVLNPPTPAASFGSGKKGAGARLPKIQSSGDGGVYTPSGVPIMRQVKKLHPAEQALLDQQRGLKTQYGDVAGQLMGKAGDMLSTPLDMASLGDMPVADTATRQNVIDSIIGRFKPQQDLDRAALETRLANQGFTQGTEGWMSSMDEINRRENDFRLAANLQGGGEMRADLAQLLGARQQSLQELLIPRNQTLQELSTFMSGSQPTMPQFAPINAPQVAAPDYAGLALGSANMENQANMNTYNAQMQNQGGGLGSLLGTAAGAVLGGPIGAGISGSLFGGGGGFNFGGYGGGYGGNAMDISGWG